MPRRAALTLQTTVAEFERGYWYATELRSFARDAGIPGAARLRKDELEAAILTLLATGKVPTPEVRNPANSKMRDVDRGLRLDLRVVAYTNDAHTKAFLEREARRLAPGMKTRSGARYRLNRWREEQIARSVEITYGDLVEQYVRLNDPSTSYARVPHGRYINFVSDFMAARPGSTTAEAARAWAELKALDVPKTYAAWTQARLD